MTRIAIFLTCLVFSNGLSLSLNEKANAAENTLPNIVFVLIDDMGFADIGCNGSEFYETPAIDRLASQGMRFTDGYAACPVCSPTRLSLMSGKYPARTHLTNYINGNRWPDNSPLRRIKWTPYMAPSEVTIAEALKSSGYKTACIGKWHLNSRDDEKDLNEATQPEHQGFDVVVGRVPNQNDKGVSGLTDAAVKFIQENKGGPFYLYLAHHSVHTPLEAASELIEKYQKKLKPEIAQNNPTYAGMVETVDNSVKRIMTTLDELDLADNTIFVFFSDNGGLNVKEGPNTPATSNLPLKNGKGFVHEGGIRVPMIVRWPNVVEAGTTCEVPVSSVDFYPTFLEASQTPPPAEHILDGESLIPLLKQTGSLKRDAIFWHYPHYSNQGGSPSGAVRVGDLKLIEFYEDGRLALYHVRRDPEERDDLAEKMPEKVAALHQRLKDWRESVNAQMPQRNSAHNPNKPWYSNSKAAPASWRDLDSKTGAEFN